MKRELKRLLLTTTEDPSDRKAWSGIPFSLMTALQNCVDDVLVLAMTEPVRTPLAVVKRVLFGPQEYPLWISAPALKANAKQVDFAIRQHAPDAVLSISSSPILLLHQSTVPMFLFSDAPYMTFAKTYSQWESFPRRLHEFGKQERALATRLSGLCYGSEWACNEAQHEYKLSAVTSSTKLHATPLGANFYPSNQDDVEKMIGARGFLDIKLLFVGRDWERKGGPLAVQIAKLIHASGVAVRLDIVGCCPAVQENFITIHGLLSRDIPEQKIKLEQLYFGSHFLLTPTRADCFGIVFAEAQAFGLPPISRAVDAVPSIVLDGETGLLFSPDAPAEDYAKRILSIYADHQSYILMARSARKRFTDLLTWERCASSIKTIIGNSLE